MLQRVPASHSISGRSVTDGLSILLGHVESSIADSGRCAMRVHHDGASTGTGVRTGADAGTGIRAARHWYHERADGADDLSDLGRHLLHHIAYAENGSGVAGAAGQGADA